MNKMNKVVIRRRALSKSDVFPLPFIDKSILIGILKMDLRAVRVEVEGSIRN